MLGFRHFTPTQVRCSIEETGYFYSVRIEIRCGCKSSKRASAVPSPESPTIEAVPQTLSNSPAQLRIGQPIPCSLPLDAPGPVRLWHLSSLDAPTVAAVWTLAFAWAGGIQLPAWIPVLLALAAWSVYIADRLLDARSALRVGNLDSLRERHLFHHRHRRVLLAIAVAAACACLWIVFTQMPSIARERNSFLAVAALAYFTSVHSSRRLTIFSISPLLKKELLVGLLFTAACALPAFTRAVQHSRGPLMAVAAYFALLAWLNCHAIDRWEARDCSNGPQIVKSACLLVLIAVPLALFLSTTNPRLASLVLAGAAAALLLALLDRRRAHLTPIALRAAADLALLTPLALFLK